MNLLPIYPKPPTKRIFIFLFIVLSTMQAYYFLTICLNEYLSASKYVSGTPISIQGSDLLIREPTTLFFVFSTTFTIFRYPEDFLSVATPYLLGSLTLFNPIVAVGLIFL